MQAKTKPVTTKAQKKKPNPGKTAAVEKIPRTAAVKKPVKTEKLLATAPEASNTESTRPRVKLVRDSFTMPREDFELIAQLKARALDFKRPAKKSELLRAGLQALAALTDVQLHAALETLRPLKAGRPKNKH